MIGYEARGRRFGVYLPDSQNPYMQQMAAEAMAAAKRLGHVTSVEFAENDSTLQVRQIHGALAADDRTRPDVVVVMAVQEGGLYHVAERVLQGSVGCIFLNRAKGSVPKLQSAYPQLPVGFVAPDQKEAGRIQARQVLALLPDGGTVACITGRVTNSSAEARVAGFGEVMAGSHVRIVASLPGNWSASEAERVFGAWFSAELAAGRAVNVVACHSDFMAAGVTKALAGLELELRRRNVRVHVLGCDGIPHVGRRQVDEGILAGTTILPTTARKAIELAHEWLHRRVKLPPEVVLAPESYPTLAALRARHVAHLRTA